MHRVLALGVAASLSLDAAAWAETHCAAREVYFRSKDSCIAKDAAIALGIYHSPHRIADKPHGIAANRRPAKGQPAGPAPAATVLPVHDVRDGRHSAPASNGNANGIGSAAPPVREPARQATSPYGALAPVTFPK